METKRKLSSKEVREMCKKNGMFVSTYFRRVKEGRKNPFSKHKIPITVNGKTYSSLSELHRASGLSIWIIRHRLKKGEPLDEKFLRPSQLKDSAPIPRTPIPISVFGKNYPSIKAACRALNVDRSVINSRKRNSKITIKKTEDGALDYSCFFYPPRKPSLFRITWPQVDEVPEGYILIVDFAKKYPHLSNYSYEAICGAIRNWVVRKHFCKCGKRAYIEEAFWKERQSWFSLKKLSAGLGITREEARDYAEKHNKGTDVLYTPVGAVKRYYLPEFLTKPHI